MTNLLGKNVPNECTLGWLILSGKARYPREIKTGFRQAVSRLARRQTKPYIGYSPLFGSSKCQRSLRYKFGVK